MLRIGGVRMTYGAAAYEARPEPEHNRTEGQPVNGKSPRLLPPMREAARYPVFRDQKIPPQRDRDGFLPSA